MKNVIIWAVGLFASAIAGGMVAASMTASETGEIIGIVVGPLIFIGARLWLGQSLKL